MNGKPISRKEAVAISMKILEEAEAGRIRTAEQEASACPISYDDDLGFDAYQKWASTTAVYPNVGKNINYPTLGLCSESGEVAGKVKKLHRDHGDAITPEIRQALIKELGDIMWYVAATCSELGLDMSVVARENMDKLNSRRDRGTLGGDGDDR